jgi:hypothetical protein
MKLQCREIIELSYFPIAKVEDLPFTFTPCHYPMDAVSFRSATALSLTEQMV